MRKGQNNKQWIPAVLLDSSSNHCDTGNTSLCLAGPYRVLSVHCTRGDMNDNLVSSTSANCPSCTLHCLRVLTGLTPCAAWQSMAKHAAKKALESVPNQFAGVDSSQSTLNSSPKDSY